MVLQVEIEDPKYPYTEGVIGYFDKYLNVLKTAKGGTPFILSTNHEFSFKILMKKKGPLSITGFVRDYGYHPYSDGTEWIEGEDSFFSFDVVAE